jgi:PAS domain S-box-containing protein
MLAAFFQRTSVPLALLDRQFNFMRVNAAYAAVVGIGAEELRGCNFFQVHANGEDPSHVEKSLAGCRPLRLSIPASNHNSAGSGEAAQWEATLLPLANAQGHVECLAVSLSRARAPGQATDEQQESYADLKARADRLRQLVGSLAAAEEHQRRQAAQSLHDDLQQLLVVAKLRADLLESRLGDEPLRQAMGELRGLLVESIEASRAVALELYPPFLHDHGLTAALEWLARWMEERHGLKVDFSADADADPQGDDVRGFLFQAVRELLTNVVRHAKVSRASVRLEKTGEGGLRITVADEGVGFSDQDRPGKAAQGVGLLHIRERLEYLGGVLEVRSAGGKGTRIRLLLGSEVLQSAVLPAVSAAAEAKDRPGRTAQRPAAPKSGRIRVLLADDHEVMREGLASLLREEADIEVIAEASDGPSAVALAGQVRPDVIIMDVTMPGMTGVEATRRIAAQWNDIRIIGLSMHERADMANKMLQAGAIAYLSKGGPAEQLLAEVRKAANLAGKGKS